MNTNETPNFRDSIFNKQMRILMSIQDFRNDFILHAQNLKALTKELVDTYHRGEEFLSVNANQDFAKTWKEHLNNVMVHANHLNHTLETSDDFMRIDSERYDFTEERKEFESRKSSLKEEALNFERIGSNALSEEFQQEWNQKYCIFHDRIEPEINQTTQYLKLIYDFEGKYSQKDLMRITKIIEEHRPENWDNPSDYERQFIKAIQEFQREFRPQNLWDNLLEILAGDVHPSPSERVMLEKWTDGEQKIREDM